MLQCVFNWVNDHKFVSWQKSKGNIWDSSDHDFAIDVHARNHPSLLVLYERMLLSFLLLFFDCFGYGLRNHRCFSFFDPITKSDWKDWTAPVVVLDNFFRFYFAIIVLCQINHYYLSSLVPYDYILSPKWVEMYTGDWISVKHFSIRIFIPSIQLQGFSVIRPQSASARTENYDFIGNCNTSGFLLVT